MGSEDGEGQAVALEGLAEDLAQGMAYNGLLSSLKSTRKSLMQFVRNGKHLAKGAADSIRPQSSVSAQEHFLSQYIQ